MDKRKFAAALAAVSAFIKTSEEAAAYAAQEGAEPISEAIAQGPVVAQPNNIWGISGRQTHMQSNTMMQLRMFK